MDDVNGLVAQRDLRHFLEVDAGRVYAPTSAAGPRPGVRVPADHGLDRQGKQRSRDRFSGGLREPLTR